MATYRITDILISLVVVGLVVSGIILIASDINDKYGSGINTEEIQYLNQIENVTSTVNEVNDRMELNSEPNALDILGYLYNQGYAAIRLVGSVPSIFVNIINSGISNLNLGGFAGILSASLVAIIMIIFVFGILLKNLIREEQ